MKDHSCKFEKFAGDTFVYFPQHFVKRYSEFSSISFDKILDIYKIVKKVKKISLLHILLLVFGFNFLNSCSPSGAKTDPNARPRVDSVRSAQFFKQIDGPAKAHRCDSVFHWKVAKQRFNGAVLVGQYGQVIYKNTSGYADFENGHAINNHTSFQLASVSKQFTAVAVLMLFEKKMLSLDDDVKKFYPEFPYNGITIRLLLSHRSGMPNYLNFAYAYWKNKSELMSNQELMDMMILHHPTRAALPDTHFEYCNTNYAILAAIVEKVSGLTFTAFMQRNVFEPLDMKDAFVYSPAALAKHPNTAIGYTPHARRGNFEFTDGVAGDKGLYCSIEDMWKWDCAMYNYQLISRETTELAYTPYSHEKRGMKNYGFGWRMIVYSPQQKAVYHNGWWHQFNNAYFRGLNDRTTIIVLGNTSNFSNYQIQPFLDALSGAKRGGAGVDAQDEEDLDK